MAYKVYRITLKSEEQRGSGKPNIVELMLNSDADAVTFGANLELLTQAKVVSIDAVVSTNYALPYPAGKDKMVRCAAWLSPYEYSFRVYDVPDAFDINARPAALIAAGFQMVSPDRATFRVPDVINVQVFTPGASV